MPAGLETLDRLLAGELSADEHTAVMRRVERDPVLRAMIDEARRVSPWAEEPEHGAQARGERRLRDVLMRFAKPMGPFGSESRVTSRARYAKPGVRGVGVVGTQTLRGSLWVGAIMVVSGAVLTLMRGAPDVHAVDSRVYATGVSQQATINLKDGTRITLAPRTVLKLQHFRDESRHVTLENGEAYFQVTHASGTPFIVRSGVITLQVLGTAFLMRHNAGEAHVRVAVTDGKVQVTTPARLGSRADTRLTLTAGQAGDVTDSTTQVSTTDDLEASADWTPDRIKFRHMAFATVLRTVTQWYGYQFRYADSTLGARRVTMVMSTRSSAEALAAIEQVLSVRLTVVGDTVTLVPQRPRANQNAPRMPTYDIWTPTREVGK